MCYRKCFVMSSWIAYMALPERAVQVHNLVLVLGLADISRIKSCYSLGGDHHGLGQKQHGS